MRENVSKSEEVDDRRRQQFRTEEDNSVQDQNKDLSEREIGGRRNRCGTEEDDGERKIYIKLRHVQ